MSRQAVANLAVCYESLGGLLAALDDEEWDVQSLCPEWSVRGVVSHLASVENMLNSFAPGESAERLPFEMVGPTVAELDGLSPADLRARVDAIFSLRREQAASYTDEQLALPSATPVGPGTYGRFMAVRVFDFWVHEQDIRRPLGRPGHEDGAAAEMAIDEIQGSLGYIVGKKIGLPDGKSITISLGGPVERDMHVRVDGRAGAVASLDDPDVVLRADSTTFALLACGRIDPQEAIDTGAVSWIGDAEWGDRSARNLAFTM